MLAALLWLGLQAPAPQAPADTIRVGTLLRRDRLAPRMSVQHTYAQTDGVRKPAGDLVHTVQRDGSRWLFITVAYSPSGTPESHDTLAVDGQTLAPRWQRHHAAHDSAAVDYLGISVRGWSRRQGQPLRRIGATLPERPFPATFLPDLLGLVSLRASSTARVELYDLWSDSLVSREFRVTGTETVQRNGKGITAWVLDVSDGGVTRRAWVARADGALLGTYDRRSGMPEGDGSWMISNGWEDLPPPPPARR